MAGKFIPDGLGVMKPGWVNAFENALTVQFNHRMLAYLIVLWVLVHTWTIFRAPESRSFRTSASWLAAAIVGQAALGIWTLLAHVPVHLGIAHQAGALVALTAALVHANAVRQSRALAVVE
jgi:cytochrome c oxidase assembly protein subunit 15